MAQCICKGHSTWDHWPLGEADMLLNVHIASLSSQWWLPTSPSGLPIGGQESQIETMLSAYLAASSSKLIETHASSPAAAALCAATVLDCNLQHCHWHSSYGHESAGDLLDDRFLEQSFLRNQQLCHLDASSRFLHAGFWFLMCSRHWTSPSRCRRSMTMPCCMQEKDSNFSYAHAPAYLKFVKECITVNFVRLEETSSPDARPLQLRLLPSSSYRRTCQALAKALKVFTNLPSRIIASSFDECQL